MSKELIITLKTDLFADKHLLKIYKDGNNYILIEQKRIKKYHFSGIKVTNDNDISYVFELIFKTRYNITINNIKNSDIVDLIKNPSLTNLDQCTDKKIEIIQIHDNWIYKKYIKYTDDWILQFSGPCSVV